MFVACSSLEGSKQQSLASQTGVKVPLSNLGMLQRSNIHKGLNMKRISTFGALLVGALAVSACAKGPDAIPPVSMGNAFSTVSCNEAKQMLVAERQTLAALETKQRSAVVGDAIGVLLIAVPVSSLTGNDVEGAIGTSKGKVVALENRTMTCG
jgi:hypothetical protein